MEHARPPAELCLDGNSVGRADAWKRWKKQFLLFLKASGVHKEESGMQASLLLNLIGSEGFDIYETFIFAEDEIKDNVEHLLKKFDIYFGIRDNVTLARYSFFTRNQEVGESMDQYVTALKLLCKKCSFGCIEEELIRDRIVCGVRSTVVRDRIVCGVRSTVVRDRLLRIEDLTLDKAIKVGQVDEVSFENKRVLETEEAAGTSASVHVIGARGLGGRGSWRSRGRRGVGQG